MSALLGWAFDIQFNLYASVICFAVVEIRNEARHRALQRGTGRRWLGFRAGGCG
jgi:hypothetical protein